LASAPIARVALAINGVPVVFPVSIVVDGDVIVFRSARGSKLDAALTSEVVAVEADRYDVDASTGWSVIVKGLAHEITDPDDLARVGALGLRPWAVDHADHFISVSTDMISGRCIGEPGDLQAFLAP
jgi:hypothetical protein